jgi:hypothetical protein
VKKEEVPGKSVPYADRGVEPTRSDSDAVKSDRINLVKVTAENVDALSGV